MDRQDTYSSADSKVPGDASRPGTAGLPLNDSTVHDSVDSPMLSRPSRVTSSLIVQRGESWDNPLASLYHMKPHLKLDDVDIMVQETVLFYLLMIASDRMGGVFRGMKSGIAFDIVLMNNTLVIQRRSRRSSSFSTKDALSTKLEEYSYGAASIPVPGVKNSMHHYQLLRYNIGSLACLVSVHVKGSVQLLPAARERSRPRKTRSVHGIDVITTGQGVRAPLAFQASFRLPDTIPRSRFEREKTRLDRQVPRLWISRQTKLGVVDLIPSGKGAGPGGLTVVELGDKVMRFEEQNQEGLQRLVRLLKKLRDTVRAHGGPGVVVFSKKTREPLPDNHSIHVYSAGREEMPVLLDWHKENFWAKKNNSEEKVLPQEKAINKDARTQKGFIGRWAGWLGF